MARVLMLHDRFGTARVLQAWLADSDRMDLARTAEQAAERLGAAAYDLCVADVDSTEDVAGLREVRRRRPTLPVVACLLPARVEEAAAVVRMGVAAVLIAPVSVEALTAAQVPVLNGLRTDREALARQIDGYLSHDFKDPKLAPALVARRYRLSLRTLERLCREHLGGSCRDILTGHRLGAAKRMLEATDEPLKVVADRCGFGGEAQLRKAWKRWYGATPGEYRRDMRGS